MAFIHHTEEEQKRFWELMNRFENEEEAIKNGFFKGFTRQYCVKLIFNRL